ncbi:MAG TPA: AsmA family protein [Gammaproteobacteria bacterium]|nr:AsmA family protein [Gammaproteobacteria bacterium]
MKGRKLLWWFLGACVLLALAIGALVALVDEEALQARFQQAAGEALGTTVTIAGPVDIGVWPTPHLAANGVRVGDAETHIADIDTVRLHIAISSLFSARPRVTHAGFSGVRVSALERELSFADVQVGVDEDADRVTLDPISLELLGGTGRGRLEGDFSAESPRWDLEFDLDGFELEAAHVRLARRGGRPAGRPGRACGHQGP